MSRTVEEWIGATDDTPIPQRVKLRIILAQDGKCACGCGQKLGGGETIEFDHIIALINGGENREGNTQALSHPCHKVATVLFEARALRDALTEMLEDGE